MMYHQAPESVVEIRPEVRIFRDTFELVAQAERYGARVALFGRKINLAESPLTIISLMRRVADRVVTPIEAVKAYHAELDRRKLRSLRALEDDLTITEATLRGY